MPGALGSIPQVNPAITVEALETGLGVWTLQALPPWLGCSGPPNPQQPQATGWEAGLWAADTLGVGGQSAGLRAA